MTANKSARTGQNSLLYVKVYSSIGSLHKFYDALEIRVGRPRRFQAEKVPPFSCSSWFFHPGPVVAVGVGPRRAPKQAVGRGFTSVDEFESDRAGSSKITRADVWSL